jgi:aspartate/tyrosine/aromatic aminotransferase
MNRAARVMGHISANPTAFMDHIEQAKPDAILGVAQAFAKDTDPRKVNVSVGAYRTDEGKPLVLRCVTAAEERLVKDKSLNKEYLKQRGDPEFAKLASTLLFGKKSAPVTEGRIASAQTLSGTGALRVGAEFVKRFLPNRSVYVSNPTWGTHKTIMAHAGVDCKTYSYWDAKTKALDFKGMLNDIATAPQGSIFLLHAAAHNPTGVDPTREQWVEIANAMAANGNIAWFDSAYQGFATGDLDVDAFAISHFANTGHPMLASQSFAKNFGLYGERVGTFNVVCAQKSSVEKVLSQLDIIIRNLYSNPTSRKGCVY